MLFIYLSSFSIPLTAQLPKYPKILSLQKKEKKYKIMTHFSNSDMEISSRPPTFSEMKKMKIPNSKGKLLSPHLTLTFGIQIFM